MKLTRLFLLTITFILTPFLILAQGEQKAYVFDVSSIDFNTNQTIKLDQDWQFYYGDFLTLDELDRIKSPITQATPSVWNGFEWEGKKLSGQGIATCRLSLQLGDTYSELALKIPEQATAYKLFVNGKLVGSAGYIGKTKGETIPETKPQIIEFPLHSNQLDIVFHIANFHHKKGGLWDSITLGQKDALVSSTSTAIYYDTFLAGAILIIALYHLGIFLLRLKDLSAFYFFLLAFFSVVRVLSTGEMFILHIFPAISWEWRLSLEHIPFYLLIGLGAMFSNTLYPNEFRKSIVSSMFILSCALVLTNIIAPPIFHSYLITPYEIIIVLELLYLSYGMFWVIYRKRRGAIAYASGFVVIFCAAINDILYSNNIIDTAYLIPFGIFLFFFSQAFVLSVKSADTYMKAEKLSMELKDINRHLEDKVQKRTEEIAAKSNELETAYHDLQNNTHELERSAKELRKSNSELETAKLQVEIAYKKEQNFRRELENTLQKLKAAQTQLVQSEKMVSLGQLTAGIAHEINNPMNFIYAGVEALKDLIRYNQEMMNKYDELEKADENTFQQIIEEVKALKAELEFDEIQDDLKQVVNDITQGAERTIEIIQGLRNFSRTDDLEVNLVDIHTCINSTLVILKNQYKHKISIVQQYDSTLKPISCNVGQINQVLMNLLVNAIQAIEGKGKIVIRTFANHDAAHISIKDSGKGIPKDVLDKIFDPFFTTKPIGEGTGLGLSISHGIIEKHQGTLTVTSTEGEGTEFTISLPFPSNN